MNQELMALYRERGVNPASGCVPMLLTLPVLFAFYALLHGRDRAARRAVLRLDSRSVAARSVLHHAGPDGRHAVLAAAHDAAGRRGSGAAEDDDVHAGRVHVHVPLGCRRASLIYWLVSNVWGIGQQYLTNYLIGPPNIRSVRPPAERRVKRVGGGQDRSGSAGGVEDDRRRRSRNRSSSSSTGSPPRWASDAASTSSRRADGSALESVGRRGGAAASGIAASRSRRCSTSSTWRSAASSRTRSACSSTRWTTARARTSSCARWRSFSPRRRKQTGVDQQLGPLNPYERRHRAPGRRGSPGRDDRKHRRRVLEDRAHLVTEVDAELTDS